MGSWWDDEAHGIPFRQISHLIWNCLFNELLIQCIIYKHKYINRWIDKPIGKWNTWHIRCRLWYVTYFQCRATLPLSEIPFYRIQNATSFLHYSMIAHDQFWHVCIIVVSRSIAVSYRLVSVKHNRKKITSMGRHGRLFSQRFFRPTFPLFTWMCDLPVQHISFFIIDIPRHPFIELEFHSGVLGWHFDIWSYLLGIHESDELARKPSKPAFVPMFITYVIPNSTSKARCVVSYSTLHVYVTEEVLTFKF